MFVRVLLIVLVLANIGYFVWAHMDSAQASAEREPQRLGQQIRPEVLQMKPRAAAPGTQP